MDGRQGGALSLLLPKYSLESRKLCCRIKDKPIVYPFMLVFRFDSALIWLLVLQLDVPVEQRTADL